MRRVKASVDASTTTPTPTARGPPAASRLRRKAAEDSPDVKEEQASSSGSRSRQASSDDDLAKRMGTVKLEGPSTPTAPVPPPAPRRPTAARPAATRTAAARIATKPRADAAASSGAQAAGPSAPPPPRVARSAAGRANTVPAAADPIPTLSPAEQSSQAKQKINTVLRHLTAAIASGFRLEGDFTAKPPSASVVKAPPRPSSVPKQSDTEGKENREWTGESVLKQITEGLEAFRMLAKGPEVQDPPKALAIEKTRVGFVGKCLALGFFREALDSLLDGRPIILSLYPATQLGEPLPASLTEFPSSSSAAPAAAPRAKPAATKVPARGRAAATATTAKAAPPTPARIKEAWWALLRTPDVDQRPMELLEEGVRVVLFSCVASGWVALLNLVQVEADAQRVSSTLRAPSPNSQSTTHWLRLVETVDPNTVSVTPYLSNAYAALSSLLRRFPWLQDSVNFQQIKLEAYITFASVSDKVTSEQVWAQMEKAASLMFNKRGSTEEAEEAGMRSAAALLENVMVWIEKGLANAPRQLQREGREWDQLTNLWLGIGRMLEEMSIINRVSLLQGKGIEDSSEVLTEAVARMTIGADKPETVFSQANTVFSKLIAMVDQVDSLDESGLSTLLATLKDTTTLKRLFAAFSQVPTSDLQATIDKHVKYFDRARRRVLRIAAAKEEKLGGHKVAARAWVTAMVVQVDAYLASLRKEDLAPNCVVFDLGAAAVDALCQLGREQLVPAEPATHTVARDALQTALLIRDRCGGAYLQDRADWTRCIAAAYYNIGATLWRASMFQAALDFLKKGAEECEEAIRMHKSDETRNEQMAPHWDMAVEQQAKRWELVASCYTNLQNKLSAAQALIRCMLAQTPSNISQILSNAQTQTPSSSFAAVEKSQAAVTKVTAFFQVHALALSFEVDQLWKVAKDSDADLDFSCAAFEAVLTNLEGTAHREGVAGVIEGLCAKLLETYDAELHPFRRLRILVKLLRLGGSFELQQHDFTVLQEEALSLCDGKVVGEDLGLLRFKSLHEASILMSRTTHTYYHQSKPQAEAYLLDLTRIRDLLREVLRDSTNLSEASDLGDLPLILETFMGVVRIVGNPLMSLDYLRLLRQAQRQDKQLLDKYILTTCQLALDFAAFGKMARASKLFVQAKAEANSKAVSEGVLAHLHLSHALFLAAAGSQEKSHEEYASAKQAAKTLQEVKKIPSEAKIRQRVEFLERAALAHLTAAEIATQRDDPSAAITHRVSAFKLFNKALDSISRLASVDRSRTPPLPSPDPFKGAPPPPPGPNPPSADEVAAKERDRRWQDIRRRHLPGEHLRLSNALLSTMALLARDYLHRGSAKEAEAHLDQATGLAEAIRSPIWKAKIACLLAESLSAQRKLDEASLKIEEAIAVLGELAGPDKVDLARVKGMLELRREDPEAAYESLATILQLLDEYEASLLLSDQNVGTPAKSKGRSPTKSTLKFGDAILSSAGARAVGDHARLLYTLDMEPESEDMLSKLQEAAKAGGDAALYFHTSGSLSVMKAFARFRSDLFLNSLTESTMSVPVGSLVTANENEPQRQEASSMLQQAEDAFQHYLAANTSRGDVAQVREALVTSALMRCYQTSLGQKTTSYMNEAVSLLDSACAITLSREMIELAEAKARGDVAADDLTWPSIKASVTEASSDELDSSESSEDLTTTPDMTGYWAEVAARHRTMCSSNGVESPDIDRLPSNWSIVSINVTDDHKTMFVAKHQPGRKPLLFCLPVDRQGKREEEDDPFTLETALSELRSIIGDSDQVTRTAKDVSTREGKADWWAKRKGLDKRLEELLTSIEFNWLGAFKTIFQSTRHMADEHIDSFRTAIEGSFRRALNSGQKNSQQGNLKLDQDIVRCFAALSTDSKPEEVDDLVYYLLDLYHFHGVPVALSEVDTDQLGVDVQSALQTLHTKSGPDPSREDDHVFLILDRKVQSIPWESLPVLRGRSASRIPSMAFLFDRLPIEGDLSGWRHDVDIQNAKYVVNPAGDLDRTQNFFAPHLAEMGKKFGWSGMAGKAPTDVDMVNMLRDNELFLYIGHGGGEQYVRSSRIRNLRSCATAMLWGCSSGLLMDGGDLDPTGLPYHYMAAGCPSLVANLWDVTDKDIDQMTMEVYQRVGFAADQKQHPAGVTSNAQAVNGAREVCKLKFLTGAAPVVFGIPVYFKTREASSDPFTRL